MSGDWFSHTLSWLSDETMNNCITLKYEELISNDECFLKLQKIFNLSEVDILRAVEVIRIKANGKKIQAKVLIKWGFITK